ncbi:nitroreductase/quinone reductase family protein [Nocardia sp. NPDC050406]|uniref:nitroreductase/quinone reductase family protein n=1 Tax=Nocardia sp. NPDC050406 TaxID=3364318 RepID=UPI0037ACF330
MATDNRSTLGRIVSAGGRFANRHGIYAGRLSTAWHNRIYRWSKGKLGGHMPGHPGARILLLDHVGAKSGTRRTSPVIYVDHNGAVAVAASKAGQPTHPAWFHNLLANPDTTIRLGDQIRPVRARVANPTERAQLWPRFVAATPDFEFYEQHAGDRIIPVVILEPR